MNPNPRMLFVAFLASIGLMVLPASGQITGTATPQSGVAPLTVQFGLQGQNVSSVGSTYWFFGDGTMGFVSSLPHTYATPGQYTAYWNWSDTYANSLYWTYGFGAYATASGSFLITVNPPVSASFTASPTSGAAPLAVSFTDTSSGQPTSWSWAFGDGTTSTAQNPTHAYAAPGNYSVTLVASNAGASNTLTKYGYISVSGAPLTISNITVCGAGTACPGPTACVVPTGLSADICINGTGFTANSVVRANGVSLPTSFNSPTQLGVTISLAASSPNFLLAGNYTVTVFQSGNTSNGVPLKVQNPVPSIAGITPSNLSSGVLAGAGPVSFTLGGAGFASNATILINGVGVPTTTVDLFTIQGVLPSETIAVPGSVLLRVSNPGPGGGLSPSSILLNLLAPNITSVFGSAIPIPVAPSTSGTVFISGSNFSSGAVAYVDGVAKPTLFLDQNTVRFTLNANLPQLQQRGALVLNVVNPGPLGVISNSFPVVVGGGGSNKGTIRRNPLAPSPGQPVGIYLENGTPGQLFTLVVDPANPAPIYPFANQVLSVGPGSWLTLADGLGIFGPPTGHAFGPDGIMLPFSYVLPNPPLGITATIQGVYLDPSAPQGYFLTWARRESL